VLEGYKNIFVLYVAMRFQYVQEACSCCIRVSQIGFHAFVLVGGGGTEFNIKIYCVIMLRYYNQSFCETLHNMRHIAGISPTTHAPGTIFCKRTL